LPDVTATPPTERAPAKGFRPDIQGLRAIAVGLVLVYHAGVSWMSGGFVGVDVFFVISGFLITTHLLGMLQREGRIRFGTFYARRVRRILPASLVVAVLSLAAGLLLMPPLERVAVLQDAIATVLYVPNVLFAWQGTDYLAETAPSLFQHYWSLGIEEQFYLVWPAILAGLFVVSRRSPRVVAAGIVLLTVLSFLACLLLMDRSEPWAFFSLPTRAWELGVGAVVALVVPRARWLADRRAGLLGYLGLLAIAAAAFAYTGDTTFPGVAAVLPVTGAALVILGGAKGSATAPGRVLTVRPMQFLGEISYSLYLVHWPLLVIPQAAVGLENHLPLWLKLGLSTAAVPLAYLSYRFIEQPFRRGGAYVAAPRKVLTVALAGPVAVALVSAVAIAPAQTVPAGSGVAPEFRPTLSPSGARTVPSNLRPTLQDVSEDVASIYDDGCHRSVGSTDADGCVESEDSDAPRVVLFGDSHAANWHPALAALAGQGMIRLDSRTKSSCASADITAADYTECATWREGVIASLRRDPPDLILLGNYAASHTAGAQDPRATWFDALRATIDRLPDSSRVVVLTDIPTFDATPAICLSSHLDDAAACSAERRHALDAETRGAEQDLAGQSGVELVDLTDYLCDADTCPAVIGDTLVYRDEHHLTATFSKALAPVMRSKVAPILAR